MDDVYRFHIDIDMDGAGLADGRELAWILRDLANACQYGIPDKIDQTIPDSNDNPVGRCWIGN